MATKKPVKAKVVKPKGPSFMDRFKLKYKLRAPHGIQLSQGETEALVEVQEKDVQILKDNQQEVLSALGVTKSIEVGSQLKKAKSARSVAASTYKITKDPIKKREWARRLVVADTTRKSLEDMKDRMIATRERLEMIKGDIELQIIDAEAKVAETKAYAKAGNQLRLAGETLISARTRAKNNKIEYTNLEITMEGAEKLINDDEPESLLAQADAIIGGKNG
jgi:hypothetical protein